MTKENKKEEKEIKLVEVESSVGDININDISDISSETEKLEKESEKVFSGIQVVYPSAGTYKIRLFPDRDSKGKLRFMNRVFFHSLLGYPLDKPKNKENEEKYRVVESEKINSDLKSAESQGFKDAFKYRAQEHVYVLCRIIDCPENDYHKPGQDVILVLIKQQGLELIKFWNELTNEQKLNMLTPTKEDYAIQLDFENKQSKFKKLESVKFAGSQKHILGNMKLPEDFTIDKEKGGILDQCYINQFDNKITDDQYKKFKNWLNYQLSFLQSGLRDPIEETSNYQSNSAPQQNTQPQSAPQSSSGEKCYIINTNQNTGDLKDVKFGNPPEHTVGECMVCENQAACEEAASKS